MLKNMKRVSMSSYPSYPVNEEVKNRLKHQSLMQDFNVLQKETVAKKKQLQREKQKKLNLLAEVRFLRRRFKYLLKNPSQKISSQHLVQPQTLQNLEIRKESSAKEQNYSDNKTSTRIPSVVFDLNQISVPNAEETGEFQVVWEPLKMEKKLNRCSMERDTFASDLKLSICRDVGNGPNQAGKRKISWQDPVALRV
ncbi:uncharacterized protein LOC143881530 [Tasmannia lanceolata]|uniref:uncharacterized protein LOC143881530 n=1 Tax=Tasmannia lanceolata TaxID=3420 RepID=UPI0040638C06